LAAEDALQFYLEERCSNIVSSSKAWGVTDTETVKFLGYKFSGSVATVLLLMDRSG